MRVRQRTHSLLVIWAPSRVRRVLRHRVVRVVGIVALGVTVASVLSAKVAALDDQQAAWGETVAVAVVTEPVAVGEPVADSIEIQQLPRIMTPPAAAAWVSPDSLAKVALYPGEVVLATRVTMAESTDAEPGTSALTLQVAAQLPQLSEGDLVDVWIVDGADMSSRRVVKHVSVLAFSDRDITVAVPNDQIEQAVAASLRPVIVTLIG